MATRDDEAGWGWRGGELARAAAWGDALLAHEQQAAAGVAAARPDHADLGRRGDLPVARLAPHLRRALVQEAVAVQPSGRQLAAVRVERQPAVTRDPRAALDERSALADIAQAERFHPRHRQPGKAVVELRHLHVGGFEIGARPQLL